MKYFQAKVDSKVKCEICGERMLKGSHRANKRVVINEFEVIYSYTLYFHKDCYERKGYK